MFQRNWAILLRAHASVSKFSDIEGYTHNDGSSFNLNWIYFDSSPKRMHFVHALLVKSDNLKRITLNIIYSRRHWLTSYLFTFLHLPLTMGLLLASSAINHMITSDNTEEPEFSGILWFFGVGLGVSVLVLATIGLLHKSLDDGLPKEVEAAHHHSPYPPVTELTKTRRSRSRKIVYGTRYDYLEYLFTFNYSK